jgi:hypothetical protein
MRNRRKITSATPPPQHNFRGTNLAPLAHTTGCPFTTAAGCPIFADHHHPGAPFMTRSGMGRFRSALSAVEGLECSEAERLNCF